MGGVTYRPVQQTEPHPVEEDDDDSVGDKKNRGWSKEGVPGLRETLEE